MPTISTHLKMMDKFSRPLQMVSKQVNTTITQMERMQKLVERPTQLNIDASKVERQLTSVQKVVQNAHVDITFNAKQAVKRAQMMKNLIQKQLNGIQARIKVELPASLNVMFSNLQRLVMRFIAATRRLEGVAGNQAEAQQQIVHLQQRILQLQSQINSQTQRASNASSGWLINLQGIAATYLSIQGVAGAIRVSDDYVNTLARLDLVNDKMQTTKDLQEQIFHAAERARGSYTDMAGVIGRMGILASEAFKSNDELIAFSELMQKSFRVGGSSTMEQQAGMYQLSQAMAAGKLQGDEFRSIMENAPMLAAAIADFTGKSKGELKEMSAEGTITAEIIKGAMFAMADDLNDKLETMPMTFGDIFTQLKNHALQEFGPVIERVNQMLNSEGGQKFVTDLQMAISSIATAVDSLLTAAVNVYSFFSNNWSWIAPLIGGITAAFVLLKVVTVGLNTVMAIQNGIQSVMAARAALVTGATHAQTAAQWGLNAAMLASPITWIILIIIALIAIIYLVIAAINHFAGTSMSATGMIAGAFAVLGAFIWNTVVGVINAIIQYLWTNFVEPWIGIIEWVLNVFNGGFNSFGDAVANLIGQIISWFLSLGKIVTKIIDAIFGTDWTSGLSSLQDNVLKWGKNEQALTLSREAPTIDSRIEYGTAWDAGYDWGDSLGFGSASDLFGQEKQEETDYSKYLNDINANLGDQSDSKDINKVKQVDKIKDSVDISSEDLKMMRELAEMKNVQNFVTLQPSISFGDTHVKRESDINTIVARIADKLQDDIASSVDAVYT